MVYIRNVPLPGERGLVEYTMKKKVDTRIRTLIENGVRQHHRSFFVIVGDRGRDQVVNLHYMLSKTVVKARPSVLWCYKKDLGFSSSKKKRMKQLKSLAQRGLVDPDKDDPFELFVSSTQIRYCYYHETDKILGSTYGMCVLQDFEAMTPNLLARAIETVEGGGLVVLLLRTMTSLKQLYTMSMDVHDRYRSEKYSEVTHSRFNERFLLSLGTCHSCLVVDDELNILPISSHARHLKPVSKDTSGDPLSVAELSVLTEEDRQLVGLKDQLADTDVIGDLVKLTKTYDQAKAVMMFLDAVSEHSLQSTVALTASRGRGKSSALGMAVAGAVSFGYSNIYVTAPSPENLKTFFEFVFKGMDELGFKEHQDYDIIQSTNPEYNKAIVRVNIFRNHRQTIQYIDPREENKGVAHLAELLVIDEAAAIPLPQVKRLLGSFLVFMASTVHGYEGTGRSLSLKLIQQLRDTCRVVTETLLEKGKSSTESVAAGGRVLREVSLTTPIRYHKDDRVESWLNRLLCFDAEENSTAADEAPSYSSPHPDECELYYVNRDTLFSFHNASEKFLQQLVNLFVSSHYRNQPNDLQLMADAPSHHVFVLLGPIKPEDRHLPEVLCAVQVCLEGDINRQTVLKNLSRGHRPQGDLIPYVVSQQYQDNDFPSLSGCRVVRIATNPKFQNMGYGRRAIGILQRFYNGELFEGEDSKYASSYDAGDDSDDMDLQAEALGPRSKITPLLQPLSTRKPEPLQYVGVSYGLTAQLFKFWQRCGFVPVYVRQTANDTTGEHSIVMLNRLHTEMDESDWLATYFTDFRKRMISLAGSEYFRKSLPSLLLLSLLKAGTTPGASGLSAKEFDEAVSVFDRKRLESYAKNLVDYHIVLDMMPLIGRLYFTGRMDVSLSPAQEIMLCGIALQYKTVDMLASDMNLPSTQLLALFNKIMRKISTNFRQLEEANVVESDKSLQISKKTVLRRDEVDATLDEELDEASEKMNRELKQKQTGLLKALRADRLPAPSAEQLESAVGKGKRFTGSVSIKRTVEPQDTPVAEETPSKKKKRKDKTPSKGKKSKKHRHE